MTRERRGRRGLARVARARIRVLRAPAAGDIAMAFAPLGNRSCVLVELESDEGAVGVGESWVSYPDQDLLRKWLPWWPRRSRY